MNRPGLLIAAACVSLIGLVGIAPTASAAIDSSALLDNVLLKYADARTTWTDVFSLAASRLFWALVLISMIWTFGIMALRQADLGEFFAEFLRFILFTGFFWWILQNGPAFAESLLASLRQLGGDATGLGGGLAPSKVVDIGFALFGRVLDQSPAWSPSDSTAGILMALAVLVMLALIGVNIVLLLISGWILAFAGIFLLGFGGSRWTSDLAVNYYKTVLAVAAQLMTIVLLLAVGESFLQDYYSRMEPAIRLKELAVILVIALTLFTLITRLPVLVSGIISGASGASIGSTAPGATITGGSLALASASMGGTALAAGAATISGGAEQLMAAFKRNPAADNHANLTIVPSAVSAIVREQHPLASAMGTAQHAPNHGGQPTAAGGAHGVGGQGSAGRKSSAGETATLLEGQAFHLPEGKEEQRDGRTDTRRPTHYNLSPGNASSAPESHGHEPTSAELLTARAPSSLAPTAASASQKNAHLPTAQHAQSTSLGGPGGQRELDAEREVASFRDRQPSTGTSHETL